LKRGGTHNFDPTGSNVSIAYSGTSFPLEITVFAYPRLLIPSGELEDHFRAALADVGQFHPSAHIQMADRMRLPLAADDVEGFTAFVTFVDRGVQLGSWVVVLPASESVVKVRAKYDRGDDSEQSGVRLRQSFEAVEMVLRAMKKEAAEQSGLPDAPKSAARG